MMGASLSSGERAPGSVRCQPRFATLESRYACSGPGWMAAAKAREMARSTEESIQISGCGFLFAERASAWARGLACALLQVEDVEPRFVNNVVAEPAVEVQRMVVVCTDL